MDNKFAFTTNKSITLGQLTSLAELMGCPKGIIKT